MFEQTASTTARTSALSIYTDKLVWLLIHQVFNESGWPSDNHVKTCGQERIIRHSDVVLPGELRGSHLKVDGCHTCARNVCKASLRGESAVLASLQDKLHVAMERWTRQWGKDVCNSVKKLVLFEATGCNFRLVRHFVLLARAAFQPMFSLWCVCAPQDDVYHDDLPYPFEVVIQAGASRLCPDVQTLQLTTSDELALSVARSGHDHTAWELEYKLSAADHLLAMTISGRTPLSLDPPCRTRAVNSALRDARMSVLGTLGEEIGQLPRRRVGRASGCDLPAAGRRRGRLDVVGPAGVVVIEDAAEGVFEDDVIDDIGDALSDLPAVDAFEILDAFEDHVLDAPGAAEGDEAGDGAAGEEFLVDPFGAGDDGVAADGEGAPPPAPLPGAPMAAMPDDHIQGPSAMGYFMDNRVGRPVCRITPVYGSSVSMKCYVHGAHCSTAMAQWKLPTSQAIRAWIAAAVPHAHDASAEQKAVVCRAHIQQMKDLMSAAVWPGHTRQGLIDEAAAAP